MSTPFTTEQVDYPGMLLDVPPSWDVGPKRFWLGNPGTMYELPSPDPANYTVTPSLGEVEQVLSDGSSSVDVLDSMTHRWGLSWQRLAGRDDQLVRAFYRGLPTIGIAPWCFVPPEDNNRLTLAQSLCGGLHGYPEGWATGGTLTYSNSVSAPIIGSGVILWTPTGSGDRLAPGPSVSTPDPAFTAPYLPAMPCAFSAWVRCPTGSATVTARLTGRDPDGNLTAGMNGPPVTLGQAWARVQVGIDPGQLLTSAYIVPNLVPADGTPIHVAAAQLEYREFCTDWGMGAGVPRVNIPTAMGRTPDVHVNSAITLTLVDAVAGAA